MKETTISLVSSKALLAVFGVRDQHVRKIREALGVRISARDGSIHVEGDDEAVARATAILEELQARVSRDGELAPEDVACVLARRPERPAGLPGDADRGLYGAAGSAADAGPGAIHRGDPRKRRGVLHRAGGDGQDLSGRGRGRRLR